MEPAKTLQQGCATGLVAALDPTIVGKKITSSLRKYLLIRTGSSGAFLQNCMLKPVEQDYAKGKENADRLWALSEKLVGEKFDL